MKNGLSQKIFTVSELTFSIKEKLESDFLSVYIKGEISDFKEHSSGHIYFTLKDKNSQISCAFFKGQRRRYNVALKSGDKVILFGDISVYPPRGNYQIIVKNVELLGVGELLLKLHKPYRCQEQGRKRNKGRIRSW